MTASRKRFFGHVLIVTGWGAFAAACVDTKPVSVPKPEAGVFADVTEEGGYAVPACRACIAAPNDPGPGCGAELQNCIDTPLCDGIYECAYALGCVFKSTTKSSLACAIEPCSPPMNSDAYGPAIVAALTLTNCFQANCTDVCGLVP